MARMTLGVRGGLLLMTVPVMLAGCTSRSDGASRVPVPQTGAPVIAPGPPVAVAPGAPAKDNELAARIISDVPAGFQLQPDHIGDTGPSDLAKAVRDEAAADSVAVLEAAGFVRGHQRLWVNETGQEILVFLYQFASEDGAQRYFRRRESLFLAPGVRMSNPLPVAGLPADSFGFSNVPSEMFGGWSGSAVVFFRSTSFVAAVQCNGSSVEAVRQRLPPLAADQVRRLA